VSFHYRSDAGNLTAVGYLGRAARDTSIESTGSVIYWNCSSMVQVSATMGTGYQWRR